MTRAPSVFDIVIILHVRSVVNINEDFRTESFPWTQRSIASQTESDTYDIGHRDKNFGIEKKIRTKLELGASACDEIDTVHPSYKTV